MQSSREFRFRLELAMGEVLSDNDEHIDEVVEDDEDEHAERAAEDSEEDAMIAKENSVLLQTFGDDEGQFGKNLKIIFLQKGEERVRGACHDLLTMQK